jgi:protein-tyrosine phosphatase
MKASVLIIILLLIVNAVYPLIADSSRREIKLQGAINFRDIGGYPTSDGRHVKWGKIYRSAELSHLTPEDLDKLQKLSLAYVADFRGPYEVKAAPDRIPATAIRVSLPAGSENTGDSVYMKHLLQSAKDSGLIPFYSNISPFHDRYKPLFDELLQVNKDSAILFHCSAGKDRTGIAATFILYALGVSEQTIIEDYLASDYYRRNANEKAIQGMMQFYKMDEATARNVLSVKESYIRATFNSIKTQYGTMDVFLEQVMGLTKDKRELLKQNFLE